jgi:hypothetical protein
VVWFQVDVRLGGEAGARLGRGDHSGASLQPARVRTVEIAYTCA